MTTNVRDKHIDELKEALIDSKPPYCAGTLALPIDCFNLFYAKAGEENAHLINLANASQASIERLASTCTPATFGYNNEDVLDESYRRAGKLDAAQFATKVDVESSGLLDAIRYDLLEGREGLRAIRVELYKLNVYGKDSFFKAHKDTPRGTDMFGSLVIVFPIQHDGGALLFNHGNNEWTFDSSKLLADAKKANQDDTTAHLGYAAFFSDVEHEVAKVVSGHRVTVTYNLYFADVNLNAAPNLDAISLAESAFNSALKAALEDDSFLPVGGYLGFGLCHEYPIETGPYARRLNKVDLVSRCLKGRDAIVRRICTSFGLQTNIRLRFMEGSCEDAQFLLDKHIDFSDAYVHDTTLVAYMQEEYNAVVIRNDDFERGCAREKDGKLIGKPEFRVQWVTDLKERFNEVEVAFLRYGNEAETSYAYGSFCLIVKVGKKGERKTVEGG